MEKKERIVRFLKKKLSVLSVLEGFSDIRVHPQIKLQTILMCVLLMPIYRSTSLLSLDRWGRKERTKQLFASSRAVIASDSTVERVLKWLRDDESAEFLRSPLPLYAREGLLARALVSGGRRIRMGLIDGSWMSGHWVVVAALLGVIRVPAVIRRMKSRGDEMSTAKEILRHAPALFGLAAPELYLLDCLYFTREIFRLVAQAGASLLVPFRDEEYRTVSRDVALHFRAFGGEREAEGFDDFRLCRYHIRLMREAFAGFPVEIAEVTEHSSKREGNREREHFWVITTALGLSPEEIREGAHQRWQIEVEVFRRLNCLCATKRGYTRHPKAFVSLLRLLCYALGALDAFMALLDSHPAVKGRFLVGQKQTWATLLESLAEAFPPGFFAPLRP